MPQQEKPQHSRNNNERLYVQDAFMNIINKYIMNVSIPFHLPLWRTNTFNPYTISNLLHCNLCQIFAQDYLLPSQKIIQGSIFVEI